MTKHRVVITGAGPVSAAGIGYRAFGDALRAGRSGIREVSLFDSAPYRSRCAAEIEDFDVTDYLESEKTYLDRSSELAFAALRLAIEHAGLDPRKPEGRGAGLVLGSAYGSLETMTLFFADFLEKGPRRVKPILFPHAYANTAISLLAIEYGLDGFHLNVSAGLVSAGCALLAGFDAVRAGRVPAVFAGGYEAFNETLFAGFDGLGVLSPGNGAAEVCAPFDCGRNGWILGEGSGVLVLEEREHARRRGARILGEILGAGMAAGASGKAGDPNGIPTAMRMAIEDAGGTAAEIDFVCASANGSPALDRLEAEAIAALPGRRPGLCVSSIKSVTGETLGAGGALQAIAALAAMETGTVPPTVNLRTPDGGNDLAFACCAENRELRRTLVNAVDPGGSGVSLVLQGEGAEPA